MANPEFDPDSLLKDVRVDVFRASGPGGQHVNKTNSAIRITHIPTGISAIAQDSPSQFRNREIALQRLLEKLTRHFHVAKKRIATRPGIRAKLKRLEQKKARGSIKAARSKPPSDD